MNRDLFPAAAPGQYVPPADTKNNAGGAAYKRAPEEALAQFAATCMFGNTYYTDAKDQLEEVLKLAAECDAEFVARCAVYSREHGWLKDMPAILLASLLSPARVDKAGAHRALRAAFPRVVDNIKMLHNFWIAVHSGRFGRKSMGSVALGLMRGWLERRSAVQLFHDQFGIENPSLGRMVATLHPVTKDPSVNAMYGYVTGPHKRTYRPRNKDGSVNLERLAQIRMRLGRVSLPFSEDSEAGTLTMQRYDMDAIPPLVVAYEAFKAAKLKGEPVDASTLDKYRFDFRAIDSLGLTDREWSQVAKKSRWMMTRMNLNTFARHNVFKIDGMEGLVASRLADPAEVKGSRNYPYQIFQAWKNIDADVPHRVAMALQDAMEIATDNVPEIQGQIAICLDVSGSMCSELPSKHARYGKQRVERMRYVDIAALFAAVIARKNPKAHIFPFDTELHGVRINPRDSVTTIAEQLAKFGGGGTSMSLPMLFLTGHNQKREIYTNIDAVIYLSDQESWADPNVRGWGEPSGTSFAATWAQLKRHNPQCKLICIDIVPSGHKQAPSGSDRLNVGGFNDRVFDVVKTFIEQKNASASHWVDTIRKIELHKAVADRVVDVDALEAQGY